MILAAGLGTRLKPFTDKHPKALALVNGKSLLQRNIEYLQKIGITELLINVHHFADQIIDAVNANKGWGSAITISDETDAVLETGGGLKKSSLVFQKRNFICTAQCRHIDQFRFRRTYCAAHFIWCARYARCFYQKQ